jgi:SH3 domain protein
MTKYLLTGLLYLLSTVGVLAQDATNTGTVDKSLIEAATEKPAVEEAPQQPREMLYVTDELRLSLYPNANDKSRALEYLSSGDRLGILEVQGPYALVIAPTGRRGWVKRGFLLSKPTSKILLKQQKKTNEDLLQEIEKLANSKVVIDQYERDMDVLTKNLKIAETAQTIAEKMVVELEQAARDKAELDASIKAAKETKTTLPVQALIDTARLYWQYLIPIFLALLLLGSLIAKIMIDARIKRRYHGLKLW